MTHEAPQDTATFHGFTAEDIKNGLGSALKPGSELILDELRQAEVLATSAIAEGLTSPDLNRQARAMRLLREMTEGPTDAPEDNEDLGKFGDTHFSPEEIKAGLAIVATDIPGEYGDMARADITTVTERPAEDQARDGLELFTEEEALAAALLIQGGAFISDIYDRQRELVRPDRHVWSVGTMDGIKEQIIKSGKITDPEHLEAVMKSAKAKVYARLKKAIKKNNRELAKAERELSNS